MAAWRHPHWRRRLGREQTWNFVLVNTSSGSRASQWLFLRFTFALTVKNLLVRKNLCGSTNKEANCSGQLFWHWQLQTAFVSWAQDVYLRSFSAIRRMMALFTPSLMDNFRSDTPGSSEMCSWALWTTAGVLAVFSLEWLCLAGLAEPSSDFSASAYFCAMLQTVNLGYPKNRIISIDKAFRLSPLFDRILHLHGLTNSDIFRLYMFYTYIWLIRASTIIYC